MSKQKAGASPTLIGQGTGEAFNGPRSTQAGIMSALREFVAVGGNRYPAASDRGLEGVAFGAHHTIAIWTADEPLEYLQGHGADITAVKFFSVPGVKDRLLVSGCLNGQLILWQRAGSSERWTLACRQTLTDGSTIHAISTCSDDSGLLFAASAAGPIFCIRVTVGASDQVVQSTIHGKFALQPRYVPMAIAAAPLPGSPGIHVLAVGGSKKDVQIFTVSTAAPEGPVRLVSTLNGHEGWIRSLAFTTGEDVDTLVLASASQDRNIRLWTIARMRDGEDSGQVGSIPMDTTSLLDSELSFQSDLGSSYDVKLDALLIGHEDWIYTVQWAPNGTWPKRLLSASADNSLSIWETDQASGIWIATQRLGEISQQKGSTSATGSTGGFWQGLWSPEGDAVMSLGKTGSWRIWQREGEEDDWTQLPAPTGHVKSVTGLTWSSNGGYLLSTSSDQTTRLWAQLKSSQYGGWHEFSRCQIHGYNLNCIDSLGDTRFVSGADEKPMRVFEEPQAVANRLETMCGLKSKGGLMPETAIIPVLGLSNKMMEASAGNTQAEPSLADQDDSDPKQDRPSSGIPLEDDLARRTLWPEIEKLYGHGYELSALACSHDSKLIASACRASSIDHAVIRIFCTSDWQEVQPPLRAHTLTVTALRFSDDGAYLLSGGRDRQCVIWKRDGSRPDEYVLVQAIPRAHSKMVLGVAWASSRHAVSVFATVGRDGRLRIWLKRLGIEAEDGGWKHDEASGLVVEADDAITAVDFCGSHAAWKGDEGRGAEWYLLAYGTEKGLVKTLGFALDLHGGVKLDWPTNVTGDETACAAGPIRQVRWRPMADKAKAYRQLAVASDDCSVQIFRVLL